QKVTISQTKRFSYQGEGNIDSHAVQCREMPAQRRLSVRSFGFAKEGVSRLLRDVSEATVSHQIAGAQSTTWGKALRKPRGVLDHQIVRVPTVYSGRISLILARAASLSLNHCTLISVYGFHSSGTSSSVKIASTGHSGSQAPQSMHSSG